MMANFKKVRITTIYYGLNKFNFTDEMRVSWALKTQTDNVAEENPSQRTCIHKSTCFGTQNKV